MGIHTQRTRKATADTQRPSPFCTYWAVLELGTGNTDLSWVKLDWPCGGRWHPSKTLRQSQVATRECFEQSEQCILGWKRVERVNKGTTLHLRLDFSHLWCIQDQAKRNSLGIDKHGFFEETKNSTTSFSSWLQERAVSPITSLGAKGWYHYHSLICRCRELLFLPSCICILPMENTNRFSTFSLCLSLSLPGVA